MRERKMCLDQVVIILVKRIRLGLGFGKDQKGLVGLAIQEISIKIILGQHIIS